MSVKVDTLLEQAVQAGLLTTDDVNGARAPLSKEKQDSTQDVLAELVRRGKVTRFQASQILKGKIKALVLGSYILLEPLGHGGMGVVFRARHTLMERTAAIKLLPPTLNKNPENVKRFLREVKAAAQLEHPNIVQAYDAGTANGRYFLAMECVQGITLDRVIKQRGRLPVSTAVDYIVQIGRGLAYAHQRNVIHRDIKPANLIVGPTQKVQILDLGLARIIEENNKRISLTGIQTSMGTVDFMAPEQALEMKKADARSDIYSLGCTLYYIIRGDVMYAGAPSTQRMMAHQQQMPPSLCEGRPDVPLKLDAVYQRMVAKRPDDRYQTMNAVLTDLQRCLGGGGPADKAETVIVPSNQTIRTVRRVPPRKKSRQPDRHLLWFIVGVVLAIPLIAGIGYGAWTLFRPTKDIAANNSSGFNTAQRTPANEPDKFKTVRAHAQQVEGVSFSADGRYALSTGTDRTINLWETASWRPVRSFVGHAGAVYSAVFTADAKRMLSASADRTVRLWDVDTAAEVRSFDHGTGVFCASLSKDGKRFVSAAGDGTVRLWEVESGKELFSLTGHEGSVWYVVFSPDGRRALSAGQDKTIRLWDLEKGQEIRTFEGHTGVVRRVAFAADGQRFLSVSWDGTMRLWNVEGGQVRCFGPSQYYLEGISFTPDGRRAITTEGPFRSGNNMATGNDHGVCLWDLDTGNLVERAGGIKGKVLELALSSDGRRALLACQDGNIRVWNLPGAPNSQLPSYIRP
jgi:serine/threonine protein kinase